MNGDQAMSAEIDTIRTSLVEYHGSMLGNYKKLLNTGLREKAGISKEELSYNIFVHSGMMFRYTGDISFVDWLTDIELNEYFGYAFEYISNLRIVALLKNYIGSTDVTDSALFDIESLIAIRDELQAFDLAASIIIKRKADTGNYEWLRKLTEAKCYANDFDLLARTDEHLISLACIDFFRQKDCFAIDFNKEDYWWLDMYDVFKSTDNSILEDAARVKVLEDSDFNTIPFVEDQRGNVVQYAPGFIAGIIKEAHLPAAAASTTQLSSVIEWDGVSKSQEALVKENPAAYASGNCLFAELVTPFTQIDDGQAFAEWEIKGKSPVYEENTSFFLLENKTGKVLGTGLIGKEGFASLSNASWVEVKIYRADYTKLTLLVVERR